MLVFHLFPQISEIYQKAIVQYITFKTAALYLRKIKHFFENINKKPRCILAIFGTFSRKSSEIHKKMMV